MNVDRLPRDALPPASLEAPAASAESGTRNVAPRSLCDRCYAPGTCCRVLYLGVLDPATEEPVSFFAPVSEGKEAAWRYVEAKGWPFAPLVPHGRFEIDGEPCQNWLFTCLALDRATGRCSRYGNRPDLCRRLEPGGDPLCVHFGGAEAGADPA